MATRLSLRAACLLLPAFVAIACGRQELDAADDSPFTARSGAAGGGAGAAGQTAGAAGHGAAGAAGQGAPASVAPATLMSPTCADLAAGGAPDALVVFNWWVASVGCSGSPKCFTQVLLHDCDLDVQSTVVPPMPAQQFKLGQQDCQAARAWVSNSRFLGALQSTSGCEPTARGEVFRVTVTNGSSPWPSTDFCPEPTIQAVRTCLGGLVTGLTHKPWP